KKPNLGENRKVTVRMERTGASPRSSRKTQGNPPSATYRLIWEAARARQQISCLYGSHHREACPHIVGYKEFGEEAVFVFQFGGTSTKGLPHGGAWRCLDLGSGSSRPMGHRNQPQPRTTLHQICRYRCQRTRDAQAPMAIAFWLARIASPAAAGRVGAPSQAKLHRRRRGSVSL